MIVAPYDSAMNALNNSAAHAYILKDNRETMMRIKISKVAAQYLE